MKKDNEHIPAQELTLRDFEMVLLSLIPQRDVIVLSDFDETLCSTYEYDPLSKIHKPRLNPDVVAETQRMRSLLFMATSRSSRESVVQTACASLISTKRLPIICENGAVLFFPHDQTEISLATPQQQQSIDAIKGQISLFPFPTIFPEREVLIKTDRVTTIEVRVQHPSGIGDSTRYDELSRRLTESCNTTDLDIVSSNNSLSIQPKGINKKTGFLRALSLLGLPRNAFFVIGLGDAFNDKEIFDEADLAIAVRKRAQHYADIVVDEGEKTSLALMKHVA